MHRTNPAAAHNSPVREISHIDQAFCCLSGVAKSHFDALGTEMNYSRGEMIVSEGELPQYIFVLRSGRVKLSVSCNEGRTLILTIAQRGQILGLNAVLSASEHKASAEALERCQVLAIPARAFMRFLATHPEAAMEATRCVLKDYEVVFNCIRRLALSTVARRLASLLLDSVRTRQQSESAKLRFTMALTQGEIADMTCTSRETVSRTLQQFQRHKLISIRGASVTVLRPEALEQLAI